MNRALWAVLLLCALTYSFDMLWGDGDGIIARLDINPLTVALVSFTLWLLLRGIQSNHNSLSNISLAAFSVLAMLFVLEKLMPYIATYQEGVHNFIQPIDGVFPYTSLDSVYFKNYVPNSRFYFEMRPVDGGKKLLHQINSQGMRGPEVPQKAAGEQRILLVGDSYIQALQVDYDSSLGPTLDRMLPDSFSVVQHGFPSWSPLLEWNWTLRKGLAFDPELVVLFLYTNDFFSGDAVGDSGYLPYTQFAQDGSPEGFDFSNLDLATAPKKRNPWTLMIQGFRRLRLVRMISFFFRQQQAKSTLREDQLDPYLKMPTQDWDEVYEAENTTKDFLTIAMWDFMDMMRDSSLWRPQLRQRVNLTLQHVKRFHNAMRERNIPLVVSLIPYPWQFAHENTVRKQEIAGWSEYVFPSGGLQEVVAAFCDKEDIPYLDLYKTTAQAKQRAPDKLIYCPSDPHWTAEGHRMAAEALLEFLQEESFFD